MNRKDSLSFALKLIIPLLIVISLFIGGVSTGIITFEQPRTISNYTLINATLSIDFGDGKTYSENMVLNNSTVLDLLLDAEKIGNISVEAIYNDQLSGFEIKSITFEEKKYSNGEGGYWWLFYINDQFATAGADKLYIKNNDSIQWKYEKF